MNSEGFRSMLTATSVTIAGRRLSIRPLSAHDSLEFITDMLHRAYAGLAAQGLRFHATFQGVEVTAQRMNGELSTVVEDLDMQRIVATVSVYKPSPDQECVWYAQPGVYRFGQFGVEPELQRSGLGGILMKLIEDQAQRLGAAEMACDTAEPALHLRRWYEAMGYRFVQFQQWNETNYRSVILSKVLSNAPPVQL